AKAVCLLRGCWLARRLREQARSHRGFVVFGGLNTIHDLRHHCLAIDGRQRLPMMGITWIA
ncbi:hypothetical protein, partial [Pseudomonas sp. 18058]|uniref:hypothetical protein n=1 Tax=Pseudomonas sp. 18058 TaxID=2681406 RepID=UPI001C498946